MDARLLHFLDGGAAASCVGDVLVTALVMHPLAIIAVQVFGDDIAKLDFGLANIDRFFTPGATSA
jgi:hypothetical protein